MLFTRLVLEITDPLFSGCGYDLSCPSSVREQNFRLVQIESNCSSREWLGVVGGMSMALGVVYKVGIRDNRPII